MAKEQDNLVIALPDETLGLIIDKLDSLSKASLRLVCKHFMCLVDSSVHMVSLCSDHAQYINASDVVQKWPNVQTLCIRNTEQGYKDFNSELVLFVSIQARLWDKLRCVEIQDELYLSTFAALVTALPNVEELLLMQPYMDYNGPSAYSSLQTMLKVGEARRYICLSALLSCKKMKKLSLFWSVDNLLVDKLANMTQLTELQIYSTADEVLLEKGDFDRLANLTNLKSLVLSHINLEEDSALKSLSSITSLQSFHLAYEYHANDSCLEDLSCLTTLTSLSVPHVTNAQEPFIPVRLLQLQNLISLNLHSVLDLELQQDLTHCPFLAQITVLRVEISFPVPQLRSLTTLSTVKGIRSRGYDHVSECLLARLAPNLKQLRMGRHSRPVPSCFSMCNTALVSLDVYCYPALEYMMQGMPGLVSLTLRQLIMCSRHAFGFDLRTLPALPNLARLTLLHFTWLGNSTGAACTMAAVLSKMTALTRLSLQGCGDISDQVMALLHLRPGLRELELVHNGGALTRAGLISACLIPAMTRIVIRDTDAISRTDIATVQEMINRPQLEIVYSPLRRTVPSFTSRPPNPLYRLARPLEDMFDCFSDAVGSDTSDEWEFHDLDGSVVGGDDGAGGESHEFHSDDAESVITESFGSSFVDDMVAQMLEDGGQWLSNEPLGPPLFPEDMEYDETFALRWFFDEATEVAED